MDALKEIERLAGMDKQAGDSLVIAFKVFLGAVTREASKVLTAEFRKRSIRAKVTAVPTKSVIGIVLDRGYVEARFGMNLYTGTFEVKLGGYTDSSPHEIELKRFVLESPEEFGPVAGSVVLNLLLENGLIKM